MEKSYIYNGLGQLVSVIENGVERQFVYDPAGIGNLVGEYNADGSLINLYGHGIGLVSRNNCFYTFDGNGNISEIIFSTGEVANSYMYAPFGAPFVSSEQMDNEFKFSGQFGVQHIDDDLVYMRNRFYSPSIGRFISEDPIGLAGGDLLFYRYVLNDPVNYIDPYGLISYGKVVGGSLAVLGGAVSIVAGSFLVIIGAAETATIATGNVPGMFVGIHTMGLGGVLISGGVTTSWISFKLVMEGLKDDEDPCDN